MRRVLPMQKQPPVRVRRLKQRTVLMTVSVRETVTPGATAPEERGRNLVLHPQMRCVASTEDTPGEIVTTTPGESMQTSKEPLVNATTAEEAAEASRHVETATAVMETEIEMQVSIISSLQRPKQLQSRDSSTHQQIREPGEPC
jgi:hypothetical protein